MKILYEILITVIFVQISVFAAHDQEQFVPVKKSRSTLSKICSGGLCSTDATRQDAYKVNTIGTSGQKIHIEHKEVSDIIDIDALDLNVPVMNNIKPDDTSTAMLSTDRSLQSKESQPVDAVVKTKPVKRSAWKTFRQMFSSPIDINTPNQKGIRPLEQAIIDGNLKEFMQLINAGADVNVFNRNGDSLLHQVVKSANSHESDHVNASMLDFLLEHGAKIDLKNKLGQTPLHCAVLTLNVEMIDILIAHKANLNLKDNQGRTPLMAIINRDMGTIQSAQFYLQQQKQAGIIQDLIRAGADITIRDNNNRLPSDDINYQIKVHGMLSQVADYIHNAYVVLNKKKSMGL